MKKNWKMTVAIVIWLLCFVVAKIWSIWGSHAGTCFYALMFVSLMVGLFLRFILYLPKKDKKVLVVTAVLFVLVAISSFIVPKGFRYRVMPKQYEAAAEYVKAEASKIDPSKENSGYLVLEEEFEKKLGDAGYHLDEDGLHYVLFNVPNGITYWADYVKVYDGYDLSTEPWYASVISLGNDWYYCSEKATLISYYGLDEVN